MLDSERLKKLAQDIALHVNTADDGGTVALLEIAGQLAAANDLKREELDRRFDLKFAEITEAPFDQKVPWTGDGVGLAQLVEIFERVWNAGQDAKPTNNDLYAGRRILSNLIKQEFLRQQAKETKKQKDPGLIGFLEMQRDQAAMNFIENPQDSDAVERVDLFNRIISALGAK